MKPRVLILLCALTLGGCATGQRLEPGLTPVRSNQPEPAGLSDALQPGIWPVERMQQAADLIATLPKNPRTLVVFDIDDTLLTTPPHDTQKQRFFGSDRWYLWQSQKPNLSPDKAKGDDIVPCLFEVIAMNYEAGSQDPTEAEAPSVVASVGFDKMILTSRSPDYREATERELKYAGYDVPALFPDLGTSKGGIGFRALATKTFVTYINGIYMIKGGSKGLLLLELLGQIGLKGHYQSVVLVDDSEDKLQDMKNELAKVSITFYGLRYEKIKPYPLEVLTKEELQDARTSWNQWEAFLRVMYPERLGQIAGKDWECK